MRRALLITVFAGGTVAMIPAMAQQPSGGTAPPNREETVPLQLKAEQVATLQQKLNERGFFAGRVDGLWGPDTAAGLRSFQQKNSLPPSGQLDPATLQALGIVDAAALPAAASPAAASSTAVSPAMPDQATTAASAPSSPSTTAAGPATSGTSLGADSTGTSPATAGAAPAPVVSTPDNTPGNPPGTAVGRTTDSTLGTNATGTNPGGSNAGQNAAAGDRNQAVATTNANAPQPAKGANSFTDGEAQRRMESSGYANVAELKKDGDGVWRGNATKDGAKVGVWLDYKGNIGQQ